MAAVLATGALIAGCGSASGSTPTLQWYSFPEPSGSFAAAAKQCSAASGGQHNIASHIRATVGVLRAPFAAE